MSKLFGTDGIRGIVGNDLNCDLALKVGASVARVVRENTNKQKLTFLIGSDTRISKDMLSSAVSAGVMSEGCDIINVGVLPTPAISYLTKYYQLDGAFIISASHNPSEYNGIKVLDKNGFKLANDLEDKCEEIILNDFKLNSNINNCGVYEYCSGAVDTYINYLISTIKSNLGKLRILVDTANGAASEVAYNLFTKLNVNFDIINNTPDGLNINKDAGSTHIDKLQEKVVNGKYDIGVSYDGDADRCILVDELGNIIDGDYIIAIAGLNLKKENKLTNNTLVGTIMTNLGFIKFCEENNINFVATKVGDKYVLEEMLKNNYILGGEQSGHIIFKELANTGDGLLTSLQILDIMAKTNKSLSTLASIMKKYPQVLINAKVSKEGKETYKDNKNIQAKIKYYEDKLQENGRIVVRPSGTENLIRVMFEGSNIDEITKYCKDLVAFIEEKLN